MQHSENPVLQRALVRARRVEETIRLSAFLADLEEINGVRVRLLTPRMLGHLVLAGSPFIGVSNRLLPTQPDVRMFLWIVSPEFCLPDGAANHWIARLIRRILKRPSAEERRLAFIEKINRWPRQMFFKRAIYRYLWRMRMGAPPTPSGGKKISASWIAATVHRVAAAYHWPDEVLDSKGRPIQGAGVLDKPLPRLYQYQKWIAIEKDSDTPQFNPITSAVRNGFRARQRQRDVASGKRNGNGDPASPNLTGQAR